MIYSKFEKWSSRWEITQICYQILIQKYCNMYNIVPRGLFYLIAQINIAEKRPCCSRARQYAPITINDKLPKQLILMSMLQFSVLFYIWGMSMFAIHELVIADALLIHFTTKVLVYYYRYSCPREWFRFLGESDF